MSNASGNNGENAIREAIEAAEAVIDPLDALVEKCKDNPGAAFEPEVVKQLALLKEDDPVGFETLRRKLKRTKCRITELDKAIAKETGETGRWKPTHADILIRLASVAELFHSPDETAFADIEINGHRETWPVRKTGFLRWLRRQFFEATGGAPNSEALQSALNVLEAKAHYDGPRQPVFIRVAELDGRLYLDLGDEDWRSVEINSNGWRVVNKPPVRFHRTSGMQPLPIPKSGGTVEMLKPFLNVSDSDFVLVVAWMLACLRRGGPYPVLVLSGEQGSAKSTFSAMLRALLDPSIAPLRALPRNDWDLFITASNQHLLAFDNVSALRPWLSDTLCRLATGGGFAVRRLYTDQDEVLFDTVRPLILNGITEIVSRPDLMDRAIFLVLAHIPDEQRRTKEEIWKGFEAARPKILGALLDAVSTGLRLYHKTRLEKLPRMADFTRWATACEKGLWPAGTFLSAYNRNRGEAVDTVMDADPVASMVLSLMKNRAEWHGTATELLRVLSDQADEWIARARAWPANPQALSRRIRRVAPLLRKSDIEVDHIREGRSRTRIIRIFRKAEKERTTPSLPSASSAKRVKAVPDRNLGVVGMRTEKPLADANGASLKESFVREISHNSLLADATDGVDAKIPSQSAAKKQAGGQCCDRGPEF